MGARSRRKGSAFELRIANALSAWAGEPASFRRTPLSGGWDRERSPGDIQGPDWWRWPVECKDRARWSWEASLRGAGPLWDWWAEAEEIRGILIVHAPRSADWLLLPAHLSRRLLLPPHHCRAVLTAPTMPHDYRTAHLHDLHQVLEFTDPALWREIGDA